MNEQVGQTPDPGVIDLGEFGVYHYRKSRGLEHAAILYELSVHEGKDVDDPGVMEALTAIGRRRFIGCQVEVEGEDLGALPRDTMMARLTELFPQIWRIIGQRVFNDSIELPRRGLAAAAAEEEPRPDPPLSSESSAPSPAAPSDRPVPTNADG